jgi:hypothetical protein
VNKWHVTYEIVTQESAEDGEAESRGYYGWGGWHHDIDKIMAMSEDERKAEMDALALSLRDALECVGSLEDCGRWFSESDGRPDYHDGSEERRSLHPPDNITPASYGRVKRLLKSMRYL